MDRRNRMLYGITHMTVGGPFESVLAQVFGSKDEILGEPSEEAMTEDTPE